MKAIFLTIYMLILGEAVATNVANKPIIDFINRLNGQGECRYQRYGQAVVLPNSQICRERLAYLENLVKSGKPFDEGISEIRNINPDILLIGELHLSHYIDTYPVLIARLKTEMPKLDCLFIEYDSDRQEEIDKMIRDPFYDGKDETLFQYLDLFKKAAATGLKVIPVDRKLHEPDGTVLGADLLWATDADGMNTRDEFMAKNMNDAFAGGQCHQAVHIGGYDHLLPQAERVTLRQNLDRAGKKTAAIMLQDTGKTHERLGSIDSPGWTWDVCPRNPAAPSSAIITKPPRAPNNVVYETWGGRWEDFDFVVLAPSTPYQMKPLPRR